MAFLTSAPADLSALQLDVWDICLRFLCAMVVGLVIGMEREYTHRPAGMRTHILVALGACAVMVTGQLIFAQYRGYGSTADPARLSAQVVSGVGFLGAGTILRDGPSIKGLTTAASLWSVACLGIAAGGGYYAVALAGMVFIFITLTIFETIQNKIFGSYGGKDYRDYRVETADITKGLDAVQTIAHNARCKISNLQVESIPGEGYRISFRGDFGSGKNKKRQKEFFEDLAVHPSIKSLVLLSDPVSTK